jgi:hypothetical protein
MTLLSLNLRKIVYYTPYSRQVLPKHRKTVRMNLKITVEEDSLWKVYINMEDYKNRMVTRTEWYPREHNGKITKIEMVS